MPNLAKRFPLYSRLLGFYPAAYRARYTEPMLQTLADMLDDPASVKPAVWFKVAADLPLSIARQQFIYLGDIMTHDTPNYVKIASLIAGGMLVPFAAAVVGNALTPGRLYNSWPWHYHVLVVWILILPALAALLSLATLAVWAAQRRRAGISFWHSAADFPHNWPLLATLGAGLFILALVFFHDSVHCVLGNPVSELSNWHQTWRCVEQR